MLRRIFLIIVTLAPGILFAQGYEKEFVVNFAWEVKQIDEFVERFDDDSTLIKEYNKEKNPSVPLTREALIKSLFNTKRTNWNFNDIKAFIKQVDDKEHPVYIDLYNGQWYALVNCSVLWNRKREHVSLKLIIQKQNNGGLKWLIEDADAKFLNQKNQNNPAQPVSQPILPTPENDRSSLNPTSHEIDFLNIDMVTTDLKNFKNYIVASNQYRDNFCLFIKECLNKHLEIIEADNIVYRCLQVKGWDIEIQQFNRQTKNSGWLISKLTKLPS